MKDEIKEILDSIQEHLKENEEKFKKGAVDSTVYYLYCDDARTLLDCITNLQNQLEEKTYLYNKLDTESKYVITNLQEEIDKLTAESTEWESKCYDLQEENEYLKKQNDEKTKIGIADHKYASKKEDEVIVLQEENKKISIQHLATVNKLIETQEENEILKRDIEAMKHNYNLLVRLIENGESMTQKFENGLTYQDYKSRIDKATNEIQYIIDYGFDYDGLNTVESLKGLIDMMVDYAVKSRNILQGSDKE